MYCNIANKYIDIGQNKKYCNIYLLERATNNIAIHWLVLSIKANDDNKIIASIIKEFQDILFYYRGQVVKRKLELYDLIIINRSFKYFR